MKNLTSLPSTRKTKNIGNHICIIDKTINTQYIFKSSFNPRPIFPPKEVAPEAASFIAGKASLKRTFKIVVRHIANSLTGLFTLKDQHSQTSERSGSAFISSGIFTR